MVQRKHDRERGLPSLAQSREQRRRAIVLGRVRLKEAAPQFWLWTMVLFLAFSVVYWFWSERELSRQKNAVMAKQRAIGQELEPRLVPLRERLERWVVELNQDWSRELIHPELDVQELSTSNGIYLRLLSRDATSSADIQRAAQTSLHDGFTSCLFVRQEQMDANKATRCFNTSQCADGELCNEWNLCSPPTQPFNMRLMYGALRVLSPGWTDELHQATSDYQVRLFQRDLEKVAKTDVKIAIDLVGTAEYFTVLLDEVPAGGIAGEETAADAGAATRPELLIQGQDHRVRLGVWDLGSEQQLFAGTFTAGADFIPMGRAKMASQRSLDAQQRQVNNCGIASDLRAAVSARRATGPQPTSGAPEEADARPSGESPE